MNINRSSRRFSLILLFCFIAQQLVADPAYITGLSPSSGKPGDTITILGQNFRDILTVKFGGVQAASFQLINSTTLKAVIGTGATGTVAITSLNGAAQTYGFTFINPFLHTISSFSPTIGQAGTEIVIKGSNFSADPSKNRVLFGGVKATVIKATQSELTVLAPTGATVSPIAVSIDDFTAYSNYPFTLTFPGGGFILPSSFGTGVYLESGQNSKNICFSDFDDDGKPDLIVVNSLENTVSIYKNESLRENPAFAKRVNFVTAQSPNSITAGDLNGDGKPDLVITNNSGGASSISTYLNTTTGGIITLGKRQEYWTGYTDYSYPEQSCIADFDLDGRPDVAVAHNDNSVTVFKNLSNNQVLSLNPGINFPAGLALKSIAAGDFDGDLKPDIAVAGFYGSKLIVLKNNCTFTQISFAAVATLNTGTDPVHIAVGDVDNDKKLDIAVANSEGHSVSVFRNSSIAGTISFDEKADFETAGYSNWVSFGDLDGDGKQDLAVANSLNREEPNGSIALLKNVTSGGKISFLPAVQFETGQTGSRSVVIADVDGDGIPDLATSAGSISVNRNRVQAAHITSFFPVYGGSGSVIAIKGYNLKNIQTVSFGGKAAASFSTVSDTSIQAVVGSGGSGSIVVSASAGNGTRTGFDYSTVPLIHHFEPLSGKPGTIITITGANFSTTPEKNTVYLGSVMAQVVSASANQLKIVAPVGAEYKPVFVTTGGLTTQANRAFYLTFPGAAPNFHAGSFAVRQDIVLSNPGNLHIADLNQDGKPDLIATDFFGDKFIIFPNTSQLGNISVGNKIQLSVQKYPGAFKTCDLDGDGKLDLIAIADRVSIYRNTTTGTNISFSTLPPIELQSGVRTYSIGDFDNDGKPDIAALTFGSLVIFKNTSSIGNISFTYKEYSGFFTTIRGITTCDFNKDGKIDLAVSESSAGVISIFNNTSTVGNISFEKKLIFGTGSGSIEGLTTTDVDGDSYADIVVNAYNINAISVLKNNSNASISFEVNANFSTGVRPNTLQISDLDGDGKPDAGAINENINATSTLSLLKNISNQSIDFLPKFDFPGIEKIGDVCFADLDLDGKPDLIGSFPYDGVISIFRNKSNEARVIPSGANPVAGNVLSTVVIDPTVQLYNGQPFLQRHYEITPANAATATATVTLFYTQEEFDNFNAHTAHGADLPKNSTDQTGIANLRIYKYHGFSASGLPGSFDGGGIEIDPDDTDITWNATAQWWEVTFHVSGFSTFFVSSNGFKYQQLPAPVVVADGNTTFCNGGQVTLRISTGSGFQWYRNGIVITNATANILSATEEGDYTATITINGIQSFPSNRVNVQVKPAPAKPVLTNNGPELISSSLTGNQWYFNGTIIQGATGQKLRPDKTGNYTVIILGSDCKSEESDKFYYTYTGIINIDNVQYVRLSPNPIGGLLYIQFTLTGVSTIDVQLIDVNGRVCGNFNHLSNSSHLNLAHYPRGIYFAKITTTNRKRYIMKLTKL